MGVLTQVHIVRISVTFFPFSLVKANHKTHKQLWQPRQWKIFKDDKVQCSPTSNILSFLLHHPNTSLSNHELLTVAFTSSGFWSNHITFSHPCPWLSKTAKPKRGRNYNCIITEHPSQHLVLQWLTEKGSVAPFSFLQGQKAVHSGNGRDCRRDEDLLQSSYYCPLTYTRLF